MYTRPFDHIRRVPLVLSLFPLFFLFANRTSPSITLKTSSFVEQPARARHLAPRVNYKKTNDTRKSSLPACRLATLELQALAGATKKSRPIYFAGRWIETRVIARDRTVPQTAFPRELQSVPER